VEGIPEIDALVVIMSLGAHGSIVGELKAKAAALLGIRPRPALLISLSPSHYDRKSNYEEHTKNLNAFSVAQENQSGVNHQGIRQNDQEADRENRGADQLQDLFEAGSWYARGTFRVVATLGLQQV
jgi:hypothetical protein